MYAAPADLARREHGTYCISRDLMIRYSVLDLAPITQGSDAAAALRNSRDLAQHAERLGFHRYWIAEHHNMPGIASAATAIVIAHVAAATQTMRVGAGGIMLPNHAPLIIAEQFGTLASLFPGRIDLGLRGLREPSPRDADDAAAAQPRVREGRPAVRQDSDCGGDIRGHGWIGGDRAARIPRVHRADEADELMVVSHIYDPGARVRSYEIVAGVRV
jgi:hypothetical protein